MNPKRVLVIGGDGYCGWATALFLSRNGYEVAILDSYVRRLWDAQLSIDTLTPIVPLPRRLAAWERVTGEHLALYVADVSDYSALAHAFADFEPDAIVHFGQQRSAPYSMLDREHAIFTQTANLRERSTFCTRCATSYRTRTW